MAVVESSDTLQSVLNQRITGATGRSKRQEMTSETKRYFMGTRLFSSLETLTQVVAGHTVMQHDCESERFGAQLLRKHRTGEKDLAVNMPRVRSSCNWYNNP
jgi:hypothetical protein